MVQLWEENDDNEVTVEQHWGHGHWDREKGSSEKLLMQLWPKTGPREKYKRCNLQNNSSSCSSY